MSMSTPGTRKLLLSLISIFTFFLIILTIVATNLPERSGPSVSSTPGSSWQGSSSKPAFLPSSSSSQMAGSSTSTVIPGTSTLPTVPTTIPFPTAPTVPNTSTVPTLPTTIPTVPTTIPAVPTTIPTVPTTIPTVPTTAPTLPNIPTMPTGPSDFDEAKFFSESVFIGDSVTLKLQRYCTANPNALHGAKILAAGSYAVRHAIAQPGGKDVISISYQGQKMRPEDALAAIGAKRVFIMLGMNDIIFGVDWTIGNWKTLINNIRAKCPDIEIYIQSGTPIHSSKDKENLCPNNTRMDSYNQALEAFCSENGCYYVPLAPYFKDANGDLADAYCSDPYSSKNPNGQGCHFTDEGEKLWIQLLKVYAATIER